MRVMEPQPDLPAQLARDLDSAFPSLVAAHQDRLYTIALRLLGDRRDAEEVTQDALVRAYRAIAGYSPERTRELRLGPWLAAITVNLARNKRRRHADRQPALALEPMLETGFDLPTDTRSGPSAVAVRRETRLELAQALLGLPPVLRTAVVLRHVDGLSVAETAAALGRPEGTVKAQVSRGLEQLRRLVAERGPTHASLPDSPTPPPAARRIATLEALP